MSTCPRSSGAVLPFFSSLTPSRRVVPLPGFLHPRAEVKLVTLHLPEQVFPLPRNRAFAVGSGRISPSPGNKGPSLCPRPGAEPRGERAAPTRPGPRRPRPPTARPRRPDSRPTSSRGGNPVRHSAENSLRSPGENLMKMPCDHTAKLSIV